MKDKKEDTCTVSEVHTQVVTASLTAIQTNKSQSEQRFTQYLHRTTGERGSSLDTEGVWLRLGESRVSWVTSFFLSASPVLGGDNNSDDVFFSLPDGLLYG